MIRTIIIACKHLKPSLVKKFYRDCRGASQEKSARMKLYTLFIKIESDEIKARGFILPQMEVLN